MKKKLIIVANPKLDSLLFRIANKYKSVKVFTTTFTPKFYYFFTGVNRRLKNMINEQTINFCGIDFLEFNVFGSVRANATDAQKILNKIK
ncbi:MAG: hypothetical protein MJK08_04610 [Campylobacterales bacterium]|nr:hypothetical protein [Campylobacterales bacterium]